MTEEVQTAVEITFAQATASIERAIAQRGEQFVYRIPNEVEQCVYFWEGEPSCLVGCVLADVGVTESDLGDDNADTPVRMLVNGGFLEVDDRTAILLTEVQDYQDKNIAWGEAYRLATAKVEGTSLAKKED